MSRKRSAFSLVEILVVLAVIAILAAIMLPVIARAKHHQTQVLCLTNLQQIHHAITLYLSDYDGSYPPLTPTLLNSSDIIVDTWNTLIMPYYANDRIGHCPMLDNTVSLMNRVPPQYMTGYALNMRLNQPSSYGAPYYAKGYKESNVHYPPITVLASEARIGIFGLAQPDAVQKNVGNPGIYATYYLDFIRTQSPAAIRHDGGANYCFADGHVKWLEPTNVNSDYQSDGVRPGFGL